jgi:glycosyltransferase involved in cell wall biosynthesis
MPSVAECANVLMDQSQSDLPKDSLLPVVSVILPTYNRAGTLDRAIQSVLNQTFTSFELIIVDDGSTDKTDLILRKYAGVEKITVLCRPRLGCAAARNAGISIARGRYLAFQDSDDEWLPEKLAKAVVALEDSDAETGVFYSDMLMVMDDGSVTDFKAPTVIQGALIDEGRLDYQVGCVGIQTAVIKRECFEKAGYFDETLPRFIDLDLFIRLSDDFRFIYCKENLVKYYRGEGISTDKEALVRARRHLLAKYRKRLQGQKHHLAQQYIYLALALEQNDEKYMSLLCFLRALIIAPRHSGIRTEVMDAVRRRRA